MDNPKDKPQVTAVFDKDMECSTPSTHNESVAGGLTLGAADQEPTVLLDRHILREQFRGNPAEQYLLERQKCTEDVIKNYPNYFSCLTSKCLEIGIINHDEAQQIIWGNTGKVLSLEERFEKNVESTAIAKELKSNLKFLEASRTGVETILESINNFEKEAKDDWVRNGNKIELFSLTTFEWSPEKLKTLGKKELRSKDPKKISNLINSVIVKKQAEISEKEKLIQESKKLYMDSIEMKNLIWFRDYLISNADCIKMFDATRLADAKLHAKTGDGGFELDVLNDPQVRSQWIPLFHKYLEQRCVVPSDGDLIFNPSEYFSSLKFYPGLYYVVKHKKGKKIWYSVAEQDIVVCDELGVVAIGEVKKNYYDIGHADIQIIRDHVMLFGEESPFKDLLREKHTKMYEEYYTGDNTIIERYLAQKDSIEKPFIKQDKCFRIKDDPCTFIITTEITEMNGMPTANYKQKLRVSGKISNQITNWIFSADCVPDDYINHKINQLNSHLNFRNIDEISIQHAIFYIIPTSTSA
jgi:hypothetical protein